ncbi:MAG: beta-N-acetylhexosaminidase [Gammaproteobacteria bacterium RIFCSPHIGHO2_12_FULL_40_19]|nr:MAG: beta-N-acetylhexosaminidase [Gammaproteobacteria bacterium RIFCSPHIGHO2_12_FULL_40_19]
MSKTNGFLWADVAGVSLTAEDKEILAHPSISGMILFSRNFESIAQLQSLTREINTISPQLIITVDQEGGRVQRFREGFTELPAMGSWGDEFATHPEKTKHDFSRMLHVMVKELQNVGIYSTLVPVLDIDYDRNTVIGHRSFGNNKNIVTALSDFVIDQFHQLKMPVTGKHFPGHGWVTVDSHFDLPIDERSLNEISEQDLQPFLQLSARLDAIMLAHIVYEQVDPQPVCFSRFWIQKMLRQQLQFDGLIISDDLSMQAVAKMGSYADRASMALEAGCDILLACNFREGLIDILDHVLPKKSEGLDRRLQRYSRFL